MKAYLIASVEVRHAARYEAYKRIADAAVLTYEGTYLVRGGKVEVLEGEWTPRRLVVVEFPSSAQAREWWDSPEYAEAKALRQSIAHTDMVIVEGQ